MKKIITAIAALLGAFAAFAQTPEEIVSRMEKEMDKHKDDGVVMTIDMKIPLLGTMTSRSYVLGDKVRLDATAMGVTIITWSDGKTKWTYTDKDNTIEIENEDPKKPTQSDGDTAMFSGVADGYDLSIKKETDKAWYILCKKSKTNKEKDDPKTMDLVISKADYNPVSLSATLSGVTMTMRDIAFNVTEKDVTFNPSDYPDAKIEDKRKN